MTKRTSRQFLARDNSTAIERIDRDGAMEVLQTEDVEVTPRQRCQNWYNKCKIDPRGRFPDEIFPVEENTDGNPMEVTLAVRTRLPRPHQYSTETRLALQREEPVEFQMVTGKDSADRAVGITAGMVLPPRQNYEQDMTVDIKGTKKADKKAADVKDTKKATASVGVKKMSSRDVALANGFRAVARQLVVDDGGLKQSNVVAISDDHGISVKDVLMLEAIANRNHKLAKKYRVAPDPKAGCQHADSIPGVVPENPKRPMKGIEKVTDEDEKISPEELCEESDACGLTDDASKSLKRDKSKKGK